MFREIRRSERITEQDRKRREEEERRRLETTGYLSIKPETEMTIEECQAFIESVFNSLRED